MRRKQTPNFVIAIGAAPHMKLSRSEHKFKAIDAPMPFGSHEVAYQDAFSISTTDL